MSDAELVSRIAHYLHMSLCAHVASKSASTCESCRHDAEKVLWMVDAYRKVEVL